MHGAQYFGSTSYPQMFQAEEHVGDHLGLAGDFTWKSDDFQDESVLRLQACGTWWHAAHRQRPLKNKQWRPGGRDSIAWDMAESLGSWHVEPLIGHDGNVSNGTGILLQFETCRWTSGNPGGPDAESSLRPDAGCGADLDSMVNAGSISLCYGVGLCVSTGRRMLVLQTDHAVATGCDVSLQATVKGLGLARSYRQYVKSVDKPRGLREPPEPEMRIWSCFSRRPPLSCNNAESDAGLGSTVPHLGSAAAETCTRENSMGLVLEGERAVQDSKSMFSQAGTGNLPTAVERTASRLPATTCEKSKKSSVEAADLTADEIGVDGSPGSDLEDDFPYGSDLEGELPYGSLDGS